MFASLVLKSVYDVGKLIECHRNTRGSLTKFDLAVWNSYSHLVLIASGVDKSVGEENWCILS